MLPASVRSSWVIEASSAASATAVAALLLLRREAQRLVDAEDALLRLQVARPRPSGATGTVASRPAVRKTSTKSALCRRTRAAAVHAQSDTPTNNRVLMLRLQNVMQQESESAEPEQRLRTRQRVPDSPLASSSREMTRSPPKLGMTGKVRSLNGHCSSKLYAIEAELGKDRCTKDCTWSRSMSMVSPRSEVQDG